MSLFYLITHFGYPLIFLITIFEGPFVTMFGAFLASLGYFNVLVVYFVVMFGDLAGDLLWYLLGRLGRHHFVEKYGYYLRIQTHHVEKLEGFFAKNAPGTIILAKITHAIGLPFIIAAGISKVDLKKFAWYSFIATIPKSFILVLIGYYLGTTYLKINNILAYLPIIALVLVGTFGILHYLNKKYFSKYS